MAKNVIFSTMSTDVAFVQYGQAPQNGIAPQLKRVVIKGGANVPAVRTLITPRGVATTVSDADMEFLQTNAAFLKALKRGFISIGSDEREADSAAASMTPKDKIAPKTPAEMETEMARLGAKGGKISTGAPVAAA